MFSDLKPYVCTFKECDLGSELFATRAEWFQHEKDCHRRMWVCIWCNNENKEFRCLTELKKHLSREHPSDLTSAQMSMLAEICQRPVKNYDSSACPFCQDWKPRRLSDNEKEFSKHLARHLQGLALDALPLAIEGFEFTEPKTANEVSDGGNSGSDKEENSRMTQPLCGPPTQESLDEVVPKTPAELRIVSDFLRSEEERRKRNEIDLRLDIEKTMPWEAYKPI